MKAFPHHYTVTTKARPEAPTATVAENKPELAVAPPAEFGGPGDIWSPEELLLASLSNCFILSFRAIAQMSRLEWTDIDCEASGVLDRVDKQIRFTGFSLNASLRIAHEADRDKAERLAHKAKESCFVSAALEITPELNCDISAG